MKKNSLKLGKARIQITPPLGGILQGHISRDQPAWRVMDDLFVKVLLFESDGERFVLVTADLIEFSHEFVDRVRNEIHGQFQIPPEHVMLCASHTHTGPTMIRLCGISPDPDYISQLTKHITGAIRFAEKKLEDITVWVGKGKTDKVGINRRVMTPKGVRQQPNPDGPIDPEVGIIRFDGSDGKPVAAIVNFSTHPTTIGIHVYEVSGDYPGRTQRIVESVYGGGMMLSFTQGAAGDVKAAVFDAAGNFKEGEEEDIEHLGRILAGEVIKTLENCQKIENPRLRAGLKKAKFPFQKIPTPDELKEWARAHRAEIEKWKHPDEETRKGIDWEDKHINRVAMSEAKLFWAEHALENLKSGKLLPYVEGDIQVFAFGNEAALVGVPGELFCEIGLAIKAKSPIPSTFVCGYTNGTLGYIPSRKAIPEGGYEISDAFKMYDYPSCLAGETEDLLYKEIGSLLK
jgi:neutral ceramidase